MKININLIPIVRQKSGLVDSRTRFTIVRSWVQISSGSQMGHTKILDLN